MHRYPSIDEMHAICEHGMDPDSGYQANCGPGGVFVEVGSTIGMVALYAASRGMKVYAFDPLRPNIDRIRESLCLNSEKECQAHILWKPAIAWARHPREQSPEDRLRHPTSFSTKI